MCPDTRRGVYSTASAYYVIFHTEMCVCVGHDFAIESSHREWNRFAVTVCIFLLNFYCKILAIVICSSACAIVRYYAPHTRVQSTNIYKYSVRLAFVSPRNRFWHSHFRLHGLGGKRVARLRAAVDDWCSIVGVCLFAICICRTGTHQHRPAAMGPGLVLRPLPALCVHYRSDHRAGQQRAAAGRQGAGWAVPVRWAIYVQ